MIIRQKLVKISQSLFVRKNVIKQYDGYDQLTLKRVSDGDAVNPRMFEAMYNSKSIR